MLRKSSEIWVTRMPAPRKGGQTHSFLKSYFRRSAIRCSIMQDSRRKVENLTADPRPARQVTLIHDDKALYHRINTDLLRAVKPFLNLCLSVFICVEFGFASC